MVDRTKRALHFVHNHPRFTKAKRKKQSSKGVWYEDSVYYLWFEYLRRNTKYKTYCETKKGSKAIADLYKDFGDIHAINFKGWWKKTGQYLFAEDEDIERVKEVASANEYAKYEKDNVLMLAIPIHKNKKWLETQIRKHLEKKRSEYGVNNRGAASTADYSLYTTPDIPSLKNALKIYDLYTLRNEELVAKGKRKHSLIEIARELDKRTAKEKEEEGWWGNWEDSAKQQVYRWNKTAKQLIENVGKGKFPKHNARG